jgi:hypothetical protein
MRWEWQTGYRNDNVHWHLQNPGTGTLTYSERYRNLQFWENALALRVIYRDIAVAARAASAFGHGGLKERYAQEELFFFHPTSAWTIEGWGYFGYSVNLTDNRTYKVILVPFLGYGANAETLHREGISPKESMCWYGPLIGGFFLIEPGGQLQFEVGYAYHWLDLRFHAKYPILNTDKFQTVKIKDSGNLGHSGWGRMDYLLSKYWRCGGFAQIQYFTSRVSNADGLSEKYKARWTAISGGLTLARTF